MAADPISAWLSSASTDYPETARRWRLIVQDVVEWPGEHFTVPGEVEAQVSGSTKFAIGGVAVGLILLIFLPWWISVLVIAAAIAVPVGAYLMLDPSQRRRLRDVQRRRQIGR
jgi:hypothetical protein